MLIEYISGLTLQSFHSPVGRLRDSYMPAFSRAILALYVSISSPSLRWFSFFSWRDTPMGSDCMGKGLSATGSFLLE